MAQFRDDLQRRAQETIKAQLGQPKAPWQKPKTTAQPKQSTTRAPARPILSPKAMAARPTSKPRAARPVSPPPPRQSSSKATPKSPPFSYWEIPPETPVREQPPQTISAQDRDAFDKLLSAGLASSPSESGEEIFATIGLDFGTSTTKVIVRFPYEPGAPAIAIPAPAHCRSMKHPYLWQTVLWVKETGEFSAYPSESANVLHALKQGVMGKHADAVVVPGAGGRPGITRTDAAAAFLAFVIRYTRGWLFTNRARLFRNRRAVWFLNVGMPVANADSAPIVSTYRQIAAAAILLGNFGGVITAESARLFLQHPDVLAAAKSVTEAEQLGVAVLPETAAEAAGFAKSTNRAPGVYVMIDVGAMTLDVCTFRLSERRSASDLYALIVAQVRPLGVEAYYWFLGQGKTEAKFVEQCDRCLREVIWRTKKDKDPHADCWHTGHDLPVFLAGGGAKNELHRRIVGSLKPWLRQHAQNEGARVLELPVPKNIDWPEAGPDFGRLAVAWGLSYPPSEIGEFFLPSVIQDKPPPRPVHWAERLIGKELV
jgi:hypothetical protein